MSSVGLANKILNLNNPPKDAPAKGKRGHGNRFNNNASNEMSQQQPLQQKQQQQPSQQPTLYHGFDGIKENPLFVENPGFGPTSEKRGKADNENNNFSYYRQNANINTVKMKRKQGNNLTNGAQTAASEVIDEYKTKYVNGDTTSVTPKKETNSYQQQRYMSKLTNGGRKNQDFSFTSVDFEDPTIVKPQKQDSQPQHEEEVLERNKDFNANEILNDYKNKRKYKGGDVPLKQPETNTAHERLRNEQLNAKMSGYHFTPSPIVKPEPPNDSKYNIYQSLKHIPNEVQQVYGATNGDDFRSTQLSQPESQKVEVEEEFNAWNAFRPKKDKQQEKARFIRKDHSDFHFGLKDENEDEDQQMMSAKSNTKPIQMIDNISNFTRDMNTPERVLGGVTKDSNASERFSTLTENLNAPDKFTELQKDLNGSSDRFTQLTNGINSHDGDRQDFSINEVLNDYKSKHVYKEEEERIAEARHEAILMKERLREKNQAHAERERLTRAMRKESVVEQPFELSDKRFDDEHSTKPTSPIPQNRRLLGGLESPKSRIQPTEAWQPSSNQKVSRTNDVIVNTQYHTEIIPEYTKSTMQEPNKQQLHNNPRIESASQHRRDVNVPYGDQRKIEPAKHQIRNDPRIESPFLHRRDINVTYGDRTKLEPVPKHQLRNDQKIESPSVHRPDANVPYRDNNGWSKGPAPEKVNPGPTTQALNYFARTSKVDSQEIKKENREVDVLQVEPSHFKRTLSSRSNPNVTFGQKDGKDIETEFSEEFGRPDDLLNAQINNNYNTDSNRNSASMSKAQSEPNLSKSKGIKSRQTTELDQLNFSNMSSQLRRSKISPSRNASYESDQIYNGNVRNVDNRIVIDNTKNKIARDSSRRSRSTLGSSRKNSITSFAPSDISQTTSERNRTTVVLAKSWSGRIVSESRGTKQSYDYGVNIPQTENVNQIVFRNKKPIEHVQMNDGNKDALSSLNSLDRRLKTERNSSGNRLNDPMEWMWTSAPNSPRSSEQNSHFYRESKYPKNDMLKLSNEITKSAMKEGQLMRVEFYDYLHKISAVVNEIIQALPKDLFPFKITPCSYQGDFEKKGLWKIDLYLNIEDLNLYKHQVNFLMKRDIAAYVVLQSENKDKLKQFCAKNRDSGDWVLSANRLMVVFSYLINTKLRSQFEHDSKNRRRKIPFDAHIKFNLVSEHEVRLDITFPSNAMTFNVGLLPALNVSDFPNVIDMNKQRTWPQPHVRAEIIKHGVHLIAKPGIRNHGWGVSFLKTRKTLLTNCDQHQTATSILLACQVINKTGLSNRDCDGLLLPAHFIMILFWLHEKHQDASHWTRENISNRFLDIVISMKRCLEQNTCADFFFQATNYFSNLSNEKRQHLLQNVDDILNNPERFISAADQQHRISNGNN